jgi:tRNA pseudouridine55 synthase
MNAPRTRVREAPRAWGAAAGQAAGPVEQQRAAKGKWLLRAEKAGHTGTLDPLATGVLPLCFGAATKFSQLQLDADKTYEATAVLGVKTATGDAEGEVMQRRPVPAITPSGWLRCPQFTGRSAGAAHAQRAQEGRQGPVRIRPRRH